MNNKLEQKCEACEGIVGPLTKEQIKSCLRELSEWKVNSKCTHITKRYIFSSYYEVISFVNAVAWISNNEKHHSELTVNYLSCTVSYTTHAINGLSLNDFICAKKIDKLIYWGSTSDNGEHSKVGARC